MTLDFKYLKEKDFIKVGRVEMQAAFKSRPNDSDKVLAFKVCLPM